MKKNILSIAVILGSLLLAIPAMAQKEWLHLYRTSSKGYTKVLSTSLSNLNAIEYLNPAADGSFNRLRISTADGTNEFNMTQIQKTVIGKQIPIMRIKIENNAEVVEKDTYLNATVSIQGNSVCDDFKETAFQIKGRGNSTWGYPKKPYRMKFEKKQQIGDFPAKSKNFALIANYIDPSMMRNILALKVAQMLELPYTNHFMPVELYINDSYRGSYFITEKIGTNGASVDIDETQGILWEMDSYFDEPYKFRSAEIGLPVMVKDPDFDELALAEGAMSAKDRLWMWADDFDELEAAVVGKSGKDWTELLDIDTAVKYVFVYCLCVNQELKHPKSTYLYKAKMGEKYHLGPVWDFDWAYTYDGHEMKGNEYRNLLVEGGQFLGSKFFGPIFKDERFQTKFKALVADFQDNRWEELMTFFNDYANLISPSAYHNGETWGSTQYHTDDVQILREFINTRIQLMRESKTGMLY